MTIEDRLIRLNLIDIKYQHGGWSLYGPYTDGFRGNTILEAVENAEVQLGKIPLQEIAANTPV